MSDLDDLLNTPIGKDLGNVFITLEQVFQTVGAALAKDYPMPALVLTYSTIDSMGWLCSGSTKGGAAAQFRAWCEEYLYPTPNALCTPQELWRARCAVLHTMTATSGKQANAHCRPVAYAWGKHDHVVLDQASASLAPGKLGTVHIDKLALELLEKTASCLTGLYDNPNTQQALLERARHYFTLVTVPTKTGQQPASDAGRPSDAPGRWHRRRR